MIQLIGWLNYWPLASWTFRNRPLLKDGAIDATNPEIVEKVPNMRALLDQAERLAAPLGLDIISAEIRQYPQGLVGAWEHSTHPIEVMVCLTSNPLARVYSDGAQWNPIPGQVLVVASDRPHCFVNFGQAPFIALTLALEKAKIDEIE